MRMSYKKVVKDMFSFILSVSETIIIACITSAGVVGAAIVTTFGKREKAKEITLKLDGKGDVLIK